MSVVPDGITCIQTSLLFCSIFGHSSTCVKVDCILIQCTTIGLFQESHFYNQWVTVTTKFKPGLCIFTYELKF